MSVGVPYAVGTSEVHTNLVLNLAFILSFEGLVVASFSLRSSAC